MPKKGLIGAFDVFIGNGVTSYEGRKEGSMVFGFNGA